MGDVVVGNVYDYDGRQIMMWVLFYSARGVSKFDIITSLFSMMTKSFFREVILNTVRCLCVQVMKYENDVWDLKCVGFRQRIRNLEKQWREKNFLSFLSHFGEILPNVFSINYCPKTVLEDDDVLCSDLQCDVENDILWSPLKRAHGTAL